MSQGIAIPVGVSVGVAALAAVMYLVYKLYVSRSGGHSFTIHDYSSKLPQEGIGIAGGNTGHPVSDSNSHSMSIPSARPTAQPRQEDISQTQRQSSMNRISADNEYRDAISGTKVFYNPLASTGTWNSMPAGDTEDILKTGLIAGMAPERHPKDQQIRAAPSLGPAYDMLDTMNQHSYQEGDLHEDRLDAGDDDAYTVTLLQQLQQLLDEVGEESRVAAAAGLAADSRVPAAEPEMSKPICSASPTQTRRLQRHVTAADDSQEAGIDRSDSQLSEAMAIAVDVVASTRHSITNISRSLNIVQALQEEQKAVNAWDVGQSNVRSPVRSLNVEPLPSEAACDEPSQFIPCQDAGSDLPRLPVARPPACAQPVTNPDIEWQRWSRQFHDMGANFACDSPLDEVTIPSVASLSQKLASLTDMASRMSERLSNHQLSSKHFECDNDGTKHRFQSATRNRACPVNDGEGRTHRRSVRLPGPDTAGHEHRKQTAQQPPKLFQGHALPPALVPIQGTAFQPSASRQFRAESPITEPCLQTDLQLSDTHHHSPLHSKAYSHRDRQSKRSTDTVRALDQTFL